MSESARALLARRRDDLLQLWVAGQSYRQIAEHFGLTRSAVAGAVKVLDLPPRDLSDRPSPKLGIPTGKKAAPTTRRKDRASGGSASDRLAPAFSKSSRLLGVGLAHLRTSQCAWPLWHNEVTFRYCGEPALPGGSWCQHHRDKVYLRASSGQQPLAPETERALVPMFTAGVPWSEMAKLSRRSTGDIAAHMAKLGLTYGVAQKNGRTWA